MEHRADRRHPLAETGRLGASQDRPCQGKAFACSRRRLLPALLQEALVTVGLMRGGQGYRLSEMTGLPDGQLALIRPIVNPSYEILVDDSWVCARHRQSGALLRLFGVEDRTALAAFNLFDGSHRLGQVGERLAEELDWEGAAGLAFARELFLDLAAQAVCVPSNPIPLAE